MADAPRPEAIDMEALEASFGDVSLDEAAAPDCPFVPLAEIFEDAGVVSRLTLLKNIGVQTSSYQEGLRATATKSLDVAQLKAANDFFAKQQFISGTDHPDKNDAHYYSLCSNALTLLFNCDKIADTDVAHILRWFSDCNVVFEEMVPNFASHSVGEKRIGGQVDVRPNPVRAAQLAEIAIARNKDQKVEKSQRQKEKAAKAKSKSGTSSNNSAAAAAVAAPSAAVVKREKPASHEAARIVLWDRLKALGLTPYKEENPNLDAQKPEGHDTHNLFVKDKKKKKYFLIMARQNAKINLKEVAKSIGMKQLRLSKDAPSILSVARGCITSLALLHDTENKCVLVRDVSLYKRDTLRICAGCEDPLDHSQHNVVDIAPAQLDELLKESGHFDDVIELEFPDA